MQEYREHVMHLISETPWDTHSLLKLPAELLLEITNFFYNIWTSSGEDTQPSLYQVELVSHFCVLKLDKDGRGSIPSTS